MMQCRSSSVSAVNAEAGMAVPCKVARGPVSHRSAFAGSPVACARPARSPMVPGRSLEKRHAGQTIVTCVAAEPVRTRMPAPATTSPGWSPSSWQNKVALQQPEYPDAEKLDAALGQMRKMPPLVFAGECRNLTREIAKAGRGEAFILQGGDCAESFREFSADNIRDMFRVILQMAVVLMYGGAVPVIKLGRMAGQFAKPRSDGMETRDSVSLPSYRGDIINDDAFTPEARIPDPFRLVRAYNQSAATLNLLRGFATGGYAAMTRVSQWNLDFMESSPQVERYRELAMRVDEAMGFMSACGVDAQTAMRTTEFFTSHEALLLHYEQALTRQDSTTGDWYDCSAHMLWLGERTRQLDGAHMEFLRGVKNPLGVKISDKADPAEVVTLIKTLNPDNIPGRLTVIVRMGAAKLRERFPLIIRAVRDAGLHVTWVSDPMHGNTIKASNGYKTRRFDSIRDELRAFFDVHDQVGTPK
eukprot:jgi/Mesvir1/19946/Mv13207-RA.2